MPSCHHAKQSTTIPRCTRRFYITPYGKQHDTYAYGKASSKTASMHKSIHEDSNTTARATTAKHHVKHAADKLQQRARSSTYCKAASRHPPDNPIAQQRGKHAAKQHVHNTLSMQSILAYQNNTHAARSQQARRQQYENGKPDNKQSCSKSDGLEIWGDTNDDDDG